MNKTEKRKIARAILTVFQYDEERWAKGAFARSSKSEGTSCPVEMGSCFCVGGAAMRAGLSPEKAALALGFKPTRYVVASTYMFKWNDHPRRTFEQVLRRLEKALV